MEFCRTSSAHQVHARGQTRPRPSPRRPSVQCYAAHFDRLHISTVAGSLVAAAAASLIIAAPAGADGTTVQEVFANKCAGCHLGGGNVVAAGATLFAPDLERNGVASPEALYNIIYSGKGKMPGYGEGCTPRGQCTFAARLPDDQVRDLATYVADRAAEGWKPVQ